MDVVERLTLEAASEETLIATEHRHRYELAAELLAGQRVLDLCCGSGYGTEILAGAGCQVVGVDNDAATVDLARVTVGKRTGAEFEAADALAYLRRADAQRFDAIVCFEGLEHLPDHRGRARAPPGAGGGGDARGPLRPQQQAVRGGQPATT